MQYPIDQYKSLAATAFTRLLNTFKAGTNSWQLGNVFDTLTDYLVRYPQASDAVAAALDRWQKTQGSLCWYDDYCWWAIASTKAFDSKYAAIFGSNTAAFQKIAIDCWNIVYSGKPQQPNCPYSYKGAPNVWANRDGGGDPNYFASQGNWAVPRIAGGVWQYDLFRMHRDSPCECAPKDNNPSDPISCLLGPFQLTVMNALYLVAALRLKLQNQGAGTDQAIQSEYVFLNQWFGQGNDSLLLEASDRSWVMVRERVPTYAMTPWAPQYPAVQGYKPNDAWCGDQGLMLGAMLDYVQQVPADPTPAQLVLTIANGALAKFVNQQNVIQPYTSGFDDHGDPDDYACGAGVFWRYLLHGFGQNTSLRNQVLGWVTSAPQNNVIYQSAQYILNNPSNPAPGSPLFRDFNVLAVLTAAIEILTAASD